MVGEIRPSTDVLNRINGYFVKMPDGHTEYVQIQDSAKILSCMAQILECLQP